MVLQAALSGGDPDSVREMAETLFAGRCVDGDIALCEAALSTQCFLKLVELGVLFPRNRYGEYIGYKTDHDPRRRATSVGPYQWPFDVRKIADGSLIIDILVYQETCKGRRVYLDYRTNPVGGAFTYLTEKRRNLQTARTVNIS